MALQTTETFPTGVIAPEAYTMIMQAQINKALNRVEAEVHVYYDMASRLAGYEPLKRFLYTIEDNVVNRRDTTLWLNVIGVGNVTITNGEDVLATATVTEEMLESETLLQDVANLLQHDSLEVTVLSNTIVVKAIGTLQGAAGAGVDVQGEAVQVINWIVGEDAVPSDLETYFGLEVQEQAGVTLQKQIYEHMKDKDQRYIDAIDV